MIEISTDLNRLTIIGFSSLNNLLPFFCVRIANEFRLLIVLKDSGNVERCSNLMLQLAERPKNPQNFQIFLVF